MTGVVKPQGMTNSNVPAKMLAGTLLEGPEVRVYGIPTSVEEVREQIRISEKQIEEGRFVTASEAIAHFYQL